jgi:hypothetical protein
MGERYETEHGYENWSSTAQVSGRFFGGFGRGCCVAVVPEASACRREKVGSGCDRSDPVPPDRRNGALLQDPLSVVMVFKTLLGFLVCLVKSDFNDVTFRRMKNEAYPSEWKR